MSHKLLSLLNGFETVSVESHTEDGSQSIKVSLESTADHHLASSISMTREYYDQLSLEDLNYYDRAITSKDQIVIEEQNEEFRPTTDDQQH